VGFLTVSADRILVWSWQHAAVRCGADDRQALEQLCRNITRPALANERVQTNAAGQAVLKLRTPWRDGTTHLATSPPELRQRHIDGQLCGIEFCERYVWIGSSAGARRVP
jgi:hypothetical protein